jgi:hypothetical protein
MATLTNASIIAQWNFNSNLDPTTEAANITAQTLGGLTDGNITPNIQHSSGEGTPVDGSGLPVDDGVGGGPDGRAYGRVFETDGSGNFQHYFDFGLTVDSGSVTFGSGSYVEFDSGHRHVGATTYAVSYSTNAFSSETFIAGGPAVVDGLSTVVGAGSPPTGGFFDWKRVNHGFTAGTLNAGDTIEFRFYLGESSGSNSDATHYMDNVTLNAVIPEPGTLALVGIAIGSLLVFYRRK